MEYRGERREANRPPSGGWKKRVCARYFSRIAAAAAPSFHSRRHEPFPYRPEPAGGTRTHLRPAEHHARGAAAQPQSVGGQSCAEPAARVARRPAVRAPRQCHDAHPVHESDHCARAQRPAYARMHAARSQPVRCRDDDQAFHDWHPQCAGTGGIAGHRAIRRAARTVDRYHRGATRPVRDRGRPAHGLARCRDRRAAAAPAIRPQYPAVDRPVRRAVPAQSPARRPAPRPRRLSRRRARARDEPAARRRRRGCRARQARRRTPHAASSTRPACR